METSGLEINSQIVLLQDKSQEHGGRFLKFPLNQEINVLLPLRELQAVINVNLQNVLPIPEVKQFCVGVSHWRGQAIWILDLANLIGANHWSIGAKIKDMGMAMLVQVEDETIGFLVETVSTISTLDPNKKLPLLESMVPEEWDAFFSGYFLDSENNSLMLLDLKAIFKHAFE